MSKTAISKKLTALFEVSAVYLLQNSGIKSELLLDVIEEMNVSQQVKVLSEDLLLADFIDCAENKDAVANRLLTLFEKLTPNNCVKVLSPILAVQAFEKVSEKVQKRFVKFFSELGTDKIFQIFASEEEPIKQQAHEHSMEYLVQAGFEDEMAALFERFDTKQRRKIWQLLNASDASETVELLKSKNFPETLETPEPLELAL